MTGFNSKREAAADKMQEPVREALKLGLEALENMCNAQSNPDRRNFPTIHDYGKAKRACIAIKEALAQPAQEPVAHVYLFDHDGRPLIAWDNAKGIKIGDKLYTTPPQRTWVGLTDDELKKIWYDMKHLIGWYSFQESALATDAKLKERNS